MPKKITIIAAIIVAVITIGATATYITLRQEGEKMKEQPVVTVAPEIDTSDWKTYRDEKYGFEVRYPRESKFKKWVDVDGIALWIAIFAPPPGRTVQEQGFNIRIAEENTLISNQWRWTVKNLLTPSYSPGDVQYKDYRIESPKKIMKDGVEGWEMVEYTRSLFNNKFEPTGIVRVFKRNNLIYQLSSRLFWSPPAPRSSPLLYSNFRFIPFAGINKR